MANKVPWYLILDLKSALSSIAIILLLAVAIVSFYYVPDLLHSYKLSSYKGEADAYLNSIEPIEMLRQTQLGNERSVDSYKVSYYYIINGFTYENTKIIKASLVRRNNLLDSNKGLKVKYDLMDPNKSMLALE